MGDLLRERIARAACATAVGGTRRLKAEEALSLLNALAGSFTYSDQAATVAPSSSGSSGCSVFAA